MKSRIISSDSHVFEPDDLWTNALRTKWGDQLPRKVHGRPDDEGEDDFDFTGDDYVRKFRLENLSEKEKQIAGVNPKSAGWDPEIRIRCMDQDRVHAELLGPTTGLFFYTVRHHDMIRDCMRVYNDWITAYCSRDPKRLLWCATIHMGDVDWAVGELERVAKHGARCVMINGGTPPGWPPFRDPAYDRFWARAEEMAMPVQLHILTGNKKHPLTLRTPEFDDKGRLHMDFANDIGPLLANEFIYGGVLDRFPGLQLVIGEYEVSWVPYWLFRLEQLDAEFGPEYNMPRLARAPRDYLAQIYFGVVDDPNVRHVDGIVAPDRLLWGSDFPHTRNTFPNSHAVVERAFAHLSAADREKVALTNAARLFKVDLPVDA